MKDKLAIFDFDGTLYNTAEANYNAYSRALGAHGVTLDPDYYVAICYGRHYKAFLPEIMPRADAQTIEQVHDLKMRLYLECLDQIRENRALFDLLKSLQTNYHIAMVSTASRRTMEVVLERFGRTGDFELILAQEDVPRKKPAPDGFLMAMEHFGVRPENTIIFEDSRTGITAARSSGAAYLTVPKF